MDRFDYIKPTLFDFNFLHANGEEYSDSCFVDCTNDAICSGDDEI